MATVRPQTLGDLHGQDHLKAQIRLAVDAAKARYDAVGHVLLTGPAGCGKTTIAGILAHERGVNFYPVIATSIKDENDLKEILASQLNADGYRKDNPEPVNPEIIKPTVVFIDEIHNLKRKVYETLYTVMEDGVYWEERKNPWSGRSQKVKTWVPRFTLVGATTREGDLEKPFLDRFRYRWKLKRYTVQECLKFVVDTLTQNKIGVDDPAAIFGIAQRARGTARIAIQLTQQCIDVCIARRLTHLTKAVVDEFFALAGIDEKGMTELDRKILMYLYIANRPIGVKAIAAYVEESTASIENHYEPYLVSMGYIGRTPRGRAITEAGVKYLQKAKLVNGVDTRRYFAEDYAEEAESDGVTV